MPPEARRRNPTGHRREASPFRRAPRLAPMSPAPVVAESRRASPHGGRRRSRSWPGWSRAPAPACGRCCPATSPSSRARRPTRQPPANVRADRSCPILLFIAGFTLVFVLLGAFASTFVQVFKGTTGQRVAGVIVVGARRADDRLRVPAGLDPLVRRAPAVPRRRCEPGVVGAFPLGMAFAAGWTPCIGPVLGGILAIAASGGTARGVFLLVVLLARARAPVPARRPRRAAARGRVRLGQAQLHGDRGRLGRPDGRRWRVAVHRGVHAHLRTALAIRARPVTGRSPELPPGRRRPIRRALRYDRRRPMSSSSPSRYSLRQSVAMVWRTLRSMRTALILLLMLAAASVAGSLIPQIPNSPERVALYLDDHPLLGDVLPAGRAVRRLRVVVVRADHGPAVRLAGRMPDPADTSAAGGRSAPRPIQAREIDAFRHYAEREVARPPDEAIEVARRTLRRRRFRVARDPDRPALAAEKGALREIGEPALPLGVHPDPGGRRSYGKGTGFSGLAPSSSRARRGSTRGRTTTARSARAGSSTASSPGSACT